MTYLKCNRTSNEKNPAGLHFIHWELIMEKEKLNACGPRFKKYTEMTS